MTLNWWTLGFQAVNVAVLVWLLGRFFWRPLANVIAERRAASERILAEAEAKRAEAAKALVEIGRTQAGFAAEREAILAAARQAAATERATGLAAAETEAAALRSAAEAAIVQERQAAEAAWSERASRLAVDIARRLLGRFEASDLHESFLASLEKELLALPDVTRRAMIADGSALEAVSADPLSPDLQRACLARIAKALDGQPKLSFRTDPALIAGLELHAPHILVSNSWRADLEQIFRDLKHDERR